MTTWWVSNLADGNDANPGTEGSPKANPHAVTLADGDTVNVKGGGAAYDRAGFAYVFDASARNSITIQRWSGFAKPVFTHTGAASGFGRCIVFGGGTNVADGLIITTTVEGGIGAPGVAGAIYTVQNCELYDIGLDKDNAVTGGGITFGATTTVGSVYVLDTIVDGCGRGNIFAKVTGTYEVGRCTLSDPGLAAPASNTGDCVASPDATPNFYWVHHNTMVHPKNAKQFIQHSDSTSPTRGSAIFEDNDFTGPSGDGDSFKGIYSEMRAIVRRNRMTTAGIAMNLQGGGSVHSNGITINGDGWGSGVGTIFILNNLANTQYVHNNVVILESGANQDVAISAFTAATGTTDIQNNIIVGAWPVGVRRHTTDAVENYNCIFGATEEVTDESNAPLSIGANTITTDPLLSGYKTLVGSPCIGAGTAVGGFLDNAGKPFKTPAMIGALESRAGQTITFASGTITPSLAISQTGTALTFSSGMVTPNSAGEVPLTGQSTTLAAGTVSPDYTRALTGVETTLSAGTTVPFSSPPSLTGQVTTLGQGTVSASGDNVTVHLSGQEMTFVTGIIDSGLHAITGLQTDLAAGTIGHDLSIPLVGQSFSLFSGLVSPDQEAADTFLQLSQGTTSANISVELVGEETLLEQGSVAVTGDVTLPLVGEATTLAAGSVGFEKAFPISGQAFVMAQQSMGAPGGAILTGASMTFSAGEVFTTGDRTFALTGQGMTIQDGALFASPLAFVTGQQITLEIQGIGPRTVALTGASIGLEQGRLAALLPEVIGGGGGYDYTYLLRKKKKKKEEKSEPITTAKEIVKIIEKPRKAPKETDEERHKKEEELLLLG